LPILLPANPLTINDVADVADFPDLHIKRLKYEPLDVSCHSSRQSDVFASPCFCHSLSDGSFYTASEAAKDEKQ
jgi:hypothetical protein